MERIAQGDPDALGELYDETSGMIFAVALRIMGQPQDAEEVVHDTYTRVWRIAGTYRPERGTVTAWLVLMARSIAIDRLRALGRRAAQALDSVAEPESGGASPEQLSLHGERSARLAAALQSIDRDQRQLIELAFFEGLSHSDLAERTGLPLGTVKTKIRTGLLKLRKNLGDLA